MFKKFICVAIVAAFAFQSSAQKADSIQQAAKQQEYLDIYRRSLQYDDMNSAAYALTRYLMVGGTNNFKDTLAIIYYRTGNLNGAFKMATEINQADPKDITALTLLADITGRAGDTKASLDWYEKLCPLAPEPYNYYQLATRQFLLERIGECKNSLIKVVADSVKARQEKVALEITAGNSENVPVLAAAYNMLGALAYRDKKTPEAKRFYELAVKEFPEFVIARQNLEGLKTTPAGAKPAAKKS
jgi:tetratricopeptide (TPR) repeat protein